MSQLLGARGASRPRQRQISHWLAAAAALDATIFLASGPHGGPLAAGLATEALASIIVAVALAVLSSDFGTTLSQLAVVANTFPAADFAVRLRGFPNGPLFLVIDLALSLVVILRLAHERAELRRHGSMVMHELAQPLAAATNFVEFARCKGDPTGLEREAIESALDDALNQLASAGAILSRMPLLSGHRPATLEIFNACSPLFHALTLIDHEIRAAQVSIVLDVDEAVQAVVRGDPVQIEQVLINIIRNALDALSRSARRVITIRAQVVGNCQAVRFSIADSGPGIATHVMTNLFRDGISTKARGRGLGLTICDTIIAAHRGAIGQYHDASGQACFWFKLPLCRGDGGRLAA